MKNRTLLVKTRDGKDANNGMFVFVLLCSIGPFLLNLALKL